MSERAKIVDGDSEHAAAWAMLSAIAAEEGKSSVWGEVSADRDWILSTYRDCLTVAQGIALE